MVGKKAQFAGFVDPPSSFSPVEEWEEFARSIEPLALEYEDMQALLDEANQIIAAHKAAPRDRGGDNA